MLENERLVVEVSSQNLALRITDKQSGLTFAHGQEEGLNKTWREFAASGLVISASIKDASTKQFPFIGQADLVREGDLLSAQVHFEEAGIGLRIDFELLSDRLVITLPFVGIEEEKPDTRLHSLQLFPFLGASYGQVEGFLLLPDGCGALVDLSRPTQARQPYYEAVYGTDLGFYGLAATRGQEGLRPTQRISLPAFGIGEGEQGLLSFIASGAEYASIQASAAGITTNYNWASAVFRYRDFYNRFSSSVQDLAQAVRTNQQEMNAFDAQLVLFPLSGVDATYSGMAGSLRGAMGAQGLLPRSTAKQAPLFASILIAENKQALLGRELVWMTSPEQAGEMVEDLQILAGAGIQAELDGYHAGGKTGHPPFIRGLAGDQAAYERLLAQQQEQGLPLLFSADYLRVYRTARGYAAGDLLRNTAGHPISMRDLANPDERAAQEDHYYHFLKPAAQQANLKRDLSTLRDLGGGGLSLLGQGEVLVSAHGREATPRDEMAKSEAKMLAQADIPLLAMSRPNAYLWPQADLLTRMPLTSSNFAIESSRVPFLQLVLSGSAPMYADFANFAANPKDYLLSLLEFGLQPSYLLTYQSADLLLETDSRWIFSAQYGIWRDLIAQHLEFLRPGFAAIGQAALIAHRQLAPGVYESSYDNGLRLVVNHSGQAYRDEEGTVAPGAYALRKEEP